MPQNINANLVAKKHPPRCLPEWVRDKGIATQKELVMALLPYLEWHSKQKLMASFVKILPHAETSPKKSFVLDRQILALMKKGLVERKYVGTPPRPASSPNATPHSYVYYRRVSKTMPRANNTAWKALIAGTYATKMKKDPKRKSRLKKTNAHLTISDVEFIRSDPYGMSTRELGGMFGIGQSAAWRITQGAYPRHLKSHFVARYS